MRHKQRTTRRTKKSKPEVPFSFSRRPARDSLCQFPYSDGRTCRLPRSHKHPKLCIFHARSEHEVLSADQAAQRLASLSGEFKTASDINHVLGELFSLVAQNRIPRREAVGLAYIAQLLLQSLPQVRNEIRNTLGGRAWDAAVHSALVTTQPKSDQSAESDDSAEAEAEVEA